MGRGDIKTKRGKISAGSFGKSRPAKQEKTTTSSVAKDKTEEAKPAKKAAPKKAK